VHQLKYRGWRALAGPMAERMAALVLPQECDEARIVIPVPTTGTRARQRGYNQAELLATAFAALTRRDLCIALERTRGTSSQIALQPAARGANVAGAFRARAGALRAMRGAHVMLIDDVLTTGATAVECAHTLDRAGVAAVTILTFARALDERRLTRT
jgi:ComF family protein